RRSRAIRWVVAASLLAIATTPSFAEHPFRLHGAQMEPLSFAALNGWADDDHAAAFSTYLKSCSAILQGTKAMRAERPLFGALYDVCGRATAARTLDDTKAKAFFEDNFRPVRIAPFGETNGFFTGYYEPVYDGSLQPHDEYKIPVYRKPANLVVAGLRKLADFPSKGAKDGRLVSLNYDAHNGLPYTPVGKFLIERGVITKDEMSMDKIREWMEANPEEGKELRRKNRSFVFFGETGQSNDEQCIGSQGVPLTPGRSLAVDKSYHVYGTPVWVDAELPIASDKVETPFRRLMFAQDTGSAIVGPARADIYWGVGEDIGHIAGRIKQFGQFVMLVPKELDPVATPLEVPLPRPRPNDIPGDKPAVEAKPPARASGADGPELTANVPLPK